jgi:hypothetical protein
MRLHDAVLFARRLLKITIFIYFASSGSWPADVLTGNAIPMQVLIPATADGGGSRPRGSYLPGFIAIAYDEWPAADTR